MGGTTFSGLKILNTFKSNTANISPLKIYAVVRYIVSNKWDFFQNFSTALTRFKPSVRFKTCSVHATSPLAARMQSSKTVPGSFFSICQSTGAAGIGSLTAFCIGVVTGAATTISMLNRSM